MLEVVSYGTLGGVIIRETDLFPNFGTDPTYLNPRARLVDGDNDGISDNWEIDKGLSPTNGADWKQLNAAGYTRLEEYVNSLGATGTALSSTGGIWTTPTAGSGSVPTLADEVSIIDNVGLSGRGFARRLRNTGPLHVSNGSLDVFDTATVNSALTISNSVVTAGRLLVTEPGFFGSISVNPGSTLQSGTIASAGGSAAMLNLNNGTYRATGVPDIQIPMTLGAGGGTIDTNSFDGEISGTITGTGGLTKQGQGELLISGPSTYTGPTDVQQGTLRVQNSAALQSSASINLAAGTQLNVNSIAGGYVIPAGQTVEGAGQIQGNLHSSPGSVMRPIGGEFIVDFYALGVQAEDLPLTSDWAVFNNAVHGTGNGGSYNGGDLFGGGIIHVDNESLTAPLPSGLISTTVDIPEAGPWYLFARVAAPSVSVAPNEVSIGPRGNNSLWVSGNSANVQATTSNFEGVQSPAADVADASVWVQLSPTLPPLSGVWNPEDAGINYNLAAGLQAFAIGGREVGTILDGFVLASENVTSMELDAALQGMSVFGSSTGMLITGDFTQHPGAVLEIGLSESDHSLLQVGGTATFSGDLAVKLLNGFVPKASEEFSIVDAGALIGQFDNAGLGTRIPTADRAGSFAVDYDFGQDTVSLSGYAAAIPGDFNFDLSVDAADLTWWQENYGGLATGADFLVWQRQFTGDLSSLLSAASTNVPAPSALVLLSFGGLIAVHRVCD